MSGIKVLSTRDLDDVLAQASASPDFDTSKAVEVQTDKAEGKLLPCRGCKAPLVVNSFYAPARASCDSCALPRQHAALLDGSGGGGPRLVDESVLIESKARYPGCRCGQLGLRKGMEVSQLIALEEGCTGSRQKARLDGVEVRAGEGGWICARLDFVRRRHGV